MTTFLFTAFAIVFIMAVVIWSMAGNSSQKAKPRPDIYMLNREGDPEDDQWFTYIAGVSHYISANEIGGFTGWVESDPDNKYSSRAMGIYNSDGKLLGYIAENELSEYRQWSMTQPLPSLGFTYIENGQIRGRVKIIRPCNADFISNEFGRFATWINNNYGPKFLPKKMSVDIHQ